MKDMKESHEILICLVFRTNTLEQNPSNSSADLSSLLCLHFLDCFFLFETDDLVASPKDDVVVVVVSGVIDSDAGACAAEVGLRLNIC